MRRFMVLLVMVPLLTGIICVLSACQGQPATPPAAGETPVHPTPAAKGPAAEVVRVLAVAGPETDVLIEQARAFEEETGITASIEQVARPLWGDRKVRELIEDSGIYDVVMVGGGDDLLWVKTKGHWLPLDNYLSAEEIATITHSDYFSRDGKLMGVPQYFNFPMLFYRRDLIEDPQEQAAFKEQYGRDLTVPTTYDELYEVAQFFHRPPDLYGFFLGGVDWSIFLDHTYFIYGMGSNYGDLETGDLTLNTTEQKRAMAALTRMAEFNPPGWETLTFFDGDQLMQEGKIFMYQNWLYIWNSFLETMPDKVGMAPPTGDVQPGAHLGAFVAVIPEAAPSPEAGARFIQWMMNYDYQKAQVLATGNLPMREDVLEDAEVKGALVGIDKYEETLPYLTYQYTTWPGELSSGVTEAIWKVLNGEMTADEACDWLQETKFADRKAIE